MWESAGLLPEVCTEWNREFNADYIFVIVTGVYALHSYS